MAGPRNGIAKTLAASFLFVVCGFAATSSRAAEAASPLSNGPWGPTDPAADDGATVVVSGPEGSKVRVTVLTDRLLRIERSDDGASFEDRKTVAMINRKLKVPKFTAEQSDGKLKIQTKCVTLTYDMGATFSSENFQVSGDMHCYQGSTAATLGWTYRYGQNDPHNLLGTIRTLDGKKAVSLNCSLRDPVVDHCEWGLVSRSGYAIYNDTLNYALSDDADWWAGPNRDQQDFYVFGHGHDYLAALSDYRLVGGYIPLVPRYALGVWFSRWYDYTAASAAEVVQQFEWRSLPLDVLVLDMNWHTKNDWTGYSFDRRLYGNPEDALAYVKARGVAVTLNLHDANGVNPWEERYADICAAVGCPEGDPVPFSIVNDTIVYALEDVVLQPLEDNGVSFWWIDWQQGEAKSGGAAGGKQNPTIWTAHVRSTNANRRRQLDPEQETTSRNMVLARWGGLGGHRYPVHFSGDVAGLTWVNLAYQLYFSMTAINVGAIWSHDIEGPAQNPELYTRWLQWGAVSGVMRSHDRGQSAGPCAAKEPTTCSTVVPWDVAPKFAHANFEALRLRGSLTPYLYTAAYQAHKTGLWFTKPFYYKWPELEGAYETAKFRPDTEAKYDPQYLFGDGIWAAPVVKPANETDGLARLHLWVPPGLWVGTSGGKVLKGSRDGSSSIDLSADLNDIPMFARAGSIIPTIPVRPGTTVGLAMKPYHELIWNVYLAEGAPTSGSGVVYEDDGMSTAYYDRDSFTLTTATYNISSTTSIGSEAARGLKGVSLDAWNAAVLGPIAKTINFTVSPSGHCEKLPTSRATTLRLINALPPTSVVVNGLSLPYARFGGQLTWSYEISDAAVKIELPVSQIAEGLQVMIEISQNSETDDQTPLDGLGFQIRRAIAAKATLDEIRLSPGSQTGQDKSPGYLLLAASAGSSLESMAGFPSRVEFNNLLQTYRSYLDGALRETQELKSDDDAIRNRIASAISLLQSALQS